MICRLNLRSVLVAAFLAILSAGVNNVASAHVTRAPDEVVTGFANETGETILMCIIGPYGNSPFYKLQKNGYLQLDFYADGSDRALVVYNASMTKILHLQSFVPGPYSLLISKDKVVRSQGQEKKPEKPDHPNAGTKPF